jgi:hypothetical protein
MASITPFSLAVFQQRSIRGKVYIIYNTSYQQDWNSWWYSTSFAQEYNRNIWVLAHKDPERWNQFLQVSTLSGTPFLLCLHCGTTIRHPNNQQYGTNGTSGLKAHLDSRACKRSSGIRNQNVATLIAVSRVVTLSSNAFGLF